MGYVLLGSVLLGLGQLGVCALGLGSVGVCAVGHGVLSGLGCLLLGLGRLGVCALGNGALHRPCRLDGGTPHSNACGDCSRLRDIRSCEHLPVHSLPSPLVQLHVLLLSMPIELVTCIPRSLHKNWCNATFLVIKFTLSKLLTCDHACIRDQDDVALAGVGRKLAVKFKGGQRGGEPARVGAG